jgi:predicted transcriptional regulator of viral defense system
MKWESFLTLIRDEAVFRSSLLLAGNESTAQVRLQLGRWVKSGRVLRLRRGIYALAPAWRRIEPHPFTVANALQRGSYVSLQSALEFHGIIPEHVPTVTSVGPGRPEIIRNPLGTFRFSHLAKNLLFGYIRIEVAPRQFAFVASPEKALLDLIYRTPGADSPEYIGELRLQNLEAMDIPKLIAMAERSGRPKLIRTARLTGRIPASSGGNIS